MEQAGGEIIISAMPGVDYRTDEGRAMTGMLAVAAEMGYNAAKKRGDRIAQQTVENGVPNRVPTGTGATSQTAGRPTRTGTPRRSSPTSTPRRPSSGSTSCAATASRGPGSPTRSTTPASRRRAASSGRCRRSARSSRMRSTSAWSCSATAATRARTSRWSPRRSGRRRSRPGRCAQWADDLGARGRGAGLLGVRQADARGRLRRTAACSTGARAGPPRARARRRRT